MSERILDAPKQWIDNIIVCRVPSFEITAKEIEKWSAMCASVNSMVDVPLWMVN